MIRVYLSDLTHETVTISSDTMPLGIGFLAAYLEKELPDRLDITLFRSPAELLEAIRRAPPQIAGFAHYCWNSEVSLMMCRILKDIDPGILTP
jgi:hypothetical protein